MPVGALNIGGKRRAGDPEQVSSALQDRGRVCLRVQGSSMLPWVRPGDVVFVERAAFDEVRSGDVVLFARDARLFVHRVVEKRGGHLLEIVTKGDAHRDADPCLPASGLLGHIVWIQRGRKRIHLDSRFRSALASFVSFLSRHAKLWYPAGRAAFRVILPVRRFFLTLLATGR
jgi:hypothetical protein